MKKKANIIARQLIINPTTGKPHDDQGLYALDGIMYGSLHIVDEQEDNNKIMHIVFAQLQSEMIEKALQRLKGREADVIRLRYGLNGERPHTLEEVGAIYNVTRERIRQIEAKVIRRLSTCKELKAFWED